MSEFFREILDVVVPAFAIASMLAVGLANPVRRLLRPMRRIRLVFILFAANFVFVPMLAWLAARIFTLDYAYEAGIILVSLTAGAPFVLKFTEIARGNVAFAASLLVLLLIGTVVIAPFTLPLLVSGAKVSPDAIGISLGWTMLAPLVIGLFIREWRPQWSARLGPWVAKSVTPLLIIVLIATFLGNGHLIADLFGTGAIAASVFVAIGAVIIGYLSSPGPNATRSILALVTGQRNIGAAIVVATQEFDTPDVLITVVVFSLVAMVILFPTAFAFGWRASVRERATVGSLYRRRVVRATFPPGRPLRPSV